MKVEIEKLDDKHYSLIVKKILFKEFVVCHSLDEALKKAKEIVEDEDTT